MKTTFLAVLFLLFAPLPTWADAQPADPADEKAAARPADEELPYGAGYEARHRQGRGHSEAVDDKERTREEIGARVRDRDESRAASNEARVERAQAERPSANRAGRREARERWGQHGATRH